MDGRWNLAPMKEGSFFLCYRKRLSISSLVTISYSSRLYLSLEYFSLEKE